MIGIDTNVLIRYVAQDDPEQSSQANAFFEELEEQRPGYVSLVTLVETWWVLMRTLKVDPDIVNITFHSLLRSKEIVVEQADTVRWAMRRVAEGADFADALITELGRSAGCERTVTFDEKAAKRATGMTLLQ